MKCLVKFSIEMPSGLLKSPFPILEMTRLQSKKYIDSINFGTISRVGESSPSMMSMIHLRPKTGMSVGTWNR